MIKLIYLTLGILFGITIIISIVVLHHDLRK